MNQERTCLLFALTTTECETKSKLAKVEYARFKFNIWQLFSFCECLSKLKEIKTFSELFHNI